MTDASSCRHHYLEYDLVACEKVLNLLALMLAVRVLISRRACLLVSDGRRLPYTAIVADGDDVAMAFNAICAAAVVVLLTSRIC